MVRIEKLNRYDWIVFILWSCRDHLRIQWQLLVLSWVVERTYRGLLVWTNQTDTPMKPPLDKMPELREQQYPDH